MINAYSPALQEDPSVHLKPIARIAPVKYQDAMHEITAYFTQGRVVSIDLAGLSDKQAARLVDFCSGYLTGASGWLFRAAEKVIVLVGSPGMDDRGDTQHAGSVGERDARWPCRR
jgi:FtsZ-interacting cell division protein YlmF